MGDSFAQWNKDTGDSIELRFDRGINAAACSRDHASAARQRSVIAKRSVLTGGDGRHELAQHRLDETAI
jgi:hypothetical protein